MAQGWTPGPWKLIWHGNEKYPFPLSLHTADDTCWVARDGTVSSEANARLIASAPALYEALDKLVTNWAALGGPAEDWLHEARAALSAARGDA